MRPGDKELIESPPRSALTTFIRIENQSPLRREMVATVVLPDGWKLITAEYPFYMAPNSSESRMLSFFIPATARAGRYKVQYRLTVRSTPEISEYADVYVVVLPSRSSALEITDFPQYSVAGTPFVVSGLIRNSSNLVGIYDLSAVSSEKYELRLNPQQIVLNPGEAGRFVVEVNTGGSIQKSLKHHLMVSAKMKGDDKVIKDDCFVTIIPALPTKRSKYIYFPVNIIGRRVVQQNGQRHTGYQGEIFGEGPLFENSSDRLRFRFRGPDIYSKSFLADHDEYFVSYRATRFNILVGDGNYNLSDLTERSRYGRGIGLNWRSGRLATGAYYQRTRWLIPKERQTAAYLRYGPENRGFIGLNYLNKQRKQLSTNVVAVEGAFRTQTNNAEFEFAADDQAKGSQKSYRASLTGHKSRFRYNLFYISADPEFSGFYRDTRYLSGSLVARLFSNLSISATAREEQQNFDIDSTKYSAPISKFYQIGLNFRLGHFFMLNADYLKSSRRDRLPVSKFDYKEESVRLTLASSSTRYALNISAESGKTYNKLLARTFDMSRLTLSARYTPTGFASFRTFVYYDNNQRYTGEKRQRITAGASMYLTWRQNTELNLDFQNNYSPEDYYFDRNLFELSFRHRLPFGHQVSLTGRHTLLRNSLDDKETAVLVEYSVPLQVPVSKKRSSATIFGKVIDGTTLKGMENVFLSLDGSTTLTRENGEFVFPPVAPGPHQLTVDHLSIGLNKVTIPSMPLTIKLEPGEERRIEIVVKEGAKIEGELFYIPKDEIEFAENSSFRFPVQIGVKNQHSRRAIDDIPVFITNGDQKLSCFTSGGGHFDFEGLQPGEWSLYIDGNRLPDNIEKDFPAQKIILGAGETEEIAIELQQKSRVVNLVPVNQVELVTQNRVSSDHRLRDLYEQFMSGLGVQPAIHIDKSLLLGMSYMRLERYDTALQEFHSIIKYSSSKEMIADAMFMAAVCYAKVGKNRLSRPFLEKLRKDYGNSPLAAVAGEMLTGKKRFNGGQPNDRYFVQGHKEYTAGRWQEALPYLIKSATLQTDRQLRDHVMFTIGECLYQLDMLDEARAVFRDIHSPNKLPGVLLRLGQIAAQKGETDLAKYHFGRTIIIAADSEYAARAASSLDGLYADYLNSPIP